MWECIGGDVFYLQIGYIEFDGFVKSFKGNVDWFIDSKNELFLFLVFMDNFYDIFVFVIG